MADNYGAPPVRGPEHSRMDVFVGTWHTEGHSYGGERTRQEDPSCSLCPLGVPTKAMAQRGPVRSMAPALRGRAPRARS